MEIRFQTGAQGNGRDGHPWNADCLILPVFKGGDPRAAAPELLEAAPWFSISPGLRDFTGKENSVMPLYGPPRAPVSRVLLAGLGEAEKFSARALRNALGTAMAFCRERKFEHVALPAEALEGICLARMQEGGDSSDKEKILNILVEEALMGAFLGCYAFAGHHCRTGEGAAERQKERLFTPASFSLLFTESHVPEGPQLAARKAEAASEGITLARNLVNGPANIVTPSHLAQQAETLARKHNFRCEVLNAQEIREQGMGALWAVAKGSRTEPCLIVLEYAPAGTENDDPLVFIGKGLTFDSGGISLKPPAKMHEMKSDMAGAAAVIGLFAALGECRKSSLGAAMPARRIVGLMPCAENMPDGQAVKPGDVIASLSGKTIEITNTDAEGRLALCDAMTLAQKNWKPALMVDIATLTGACVMALGENAAGLFCDDEELRGRIARRGEIMGERFWPLPLWDDHAGLLDSDVADLVNVGPREGGALWAALFLKQFVEKGTLWAHLDIAGPAYAGKSTPLCPGGGTGFGVRTLFELACAKADQS